MRTKYGGVRFARMTLAIVWVAAASLSTAEAPLRLRWMQQAGGKGHDKARGLCVDGQGCCYVTGEIEGESQFANITLVARGGLDAFVAKYDRSGQLMWTRSGGGDRTDRGYAVAADETGGCVVVGHFESSELVIEGVALRNAGGYDGYVARFDGAGNLLWARSLGGKGIDGSFGVAIDKTGNVYVNGSVTGPLEIHDAQIMNPKPTFALTKFDPAGNILWVRHAESGRPCGARGIAIDESGNVYPTGFFAGKSKFGSVTVAGGDGQDIFLAKYSSDGETVWVRDAGGRSNGLGRSVSVDSQGAVYLTGMFNKTVTFGADSFATRGDNDGFIVKYLPNSEVAWARQIGGRGKDEALALAVGKNGAVVVTGDYYGDLSFEGTLLPSQGKQDSFVAQTDLEGKPHWARSIGGAPQEISYCVGISPTGEIYLAIGFTDTLLANDARLASRGRLDILVGVLDPD